MALSYSISHAIQNTTSPPIPKAQEWASTYLSSHPSLPLLDLSQGLPKDPPHPSVLAGLAQASQDPDSAKYGPILGEPSFRTAFSATLRQLYSLDSHDLTEGDVSITAGCNQALLITLMTLCPPLSKVLLPLPIYFNADMSLSLISVQPVYIPCDTQKGFRPDITAARKALGVENHGIRLILLITPNNPTGTVLSPEEMEEWFDLAQSHHVALVVDETYRDFVVDPTSGEPGVPHRLFRRRDWRGTLISLGSFSKGYRIPGHRLGSIAASPELFREMAKVCDCMQICPPRPPQLALTPLLPSLQSDIHSSSLALAARRALFVATLKTVPGWRVDSIGGFFAYVSFPPDYAFASATFGKKRKRLGSPEIAEQLAIKVGVLCLPGSFFMPSSGPGWDEGVGEGRAGGLSEDRWVRFSVANVGDEVVVQLGERLRRMNQIMGMIDDGDTEDQ